MTKVNVDYNKNNNEIVLTGDINVLIKNRFALNYIKNFLTKNITNEMIIIPIGDNVPQDILSAVSTMLKKYSILEGKSDSSEKILKDFWEEERRFEEFSEKALHIRNNECVKIEFAEFVDSVEKNLRNRSLYGLQLLSAYHLAFSQNACNFSVPGAGKTSIVYGAYSYLKNLPESHEKKIDKILIVGPLSSFGPWELEYEECFGFKATVRRLTSNIDKQSKIDYLYSKNTNEITLISYASLASVKDAINWFLKNNKVMVVLDEAHKIKNTNGGMTAQAVMDISPFGRARVVLTGTPAPNGYEDLYNLFKFIWPTKNIMHFQVNQLRDMSKRNHDHRVDRLIKYISPFFIRIKKSDLKIPPATINPPIRVNMGYHQRRIYDFIEKRYMNDMLQNNEMDLTSRFKSQVISAKFIRLMQAATNPKLLAMPLSDFFESEDIDAGNISMIDDADILREIMQYSDNEIPEKFIKAKELIKKIINSGEKVVVWACFIQTILDFKFYLEKNGIKCQELYGATPVRQDDNGDSSESQELTRETIVKLFNEVNSPFNVIIANPFAVAESISLHKTCHNAIYIERTFNAAHFIQSKDRIHRYGLKPNEKTNYYFIISNDSIDEVIDERLTIKEKRMIEIMESMPIPLFDNMDENLGNEDIKAMIDNYVRRTKKTY